MMKRKWLISLVFIALIAASCQKKAKNETVALDTKEKRIGYMLGIKTAQDIKNTGAAVDVNSYSQGFRDGFTGAKLQMSEKEINDTLELFKQDIQNKQREELNQMSVQNLRQEEVFLLENGKKPDVTTTVSGLQYRVITQGTGPKPKETDIVRVHYRGYFPNTNEFDSSYKRNQPAEFPLNGVIRGWIEGLQLMAVGSKFQFVVPSRLAYGQKGAGNVIGPNQVLLFDVELLEIVKPSAKK